MARFALAFLAAEAAPLVSVVVSRHGIRTPYPPGGEGNLTKEALAKYTTQSFPECWPPGAGSAVWGTSATAGLTPHGGEQIRLMGAWMGSSNFSQLSCEEVAVYSDFGSSRDNETATNWTLGAFPSCPDLHREDALLGDPRHFLFNDGSNEELCGFPSLEVTQSFLGGAQFRSALLNAWRAQMDLVDSVVHCCPATQLCGGQLPCNLSALPITFSGKFWAATEGALNIAVFWAEFFLLEYLNGNPQFAKGQLSLGQLVDLYRMTVANVEYVDTTVSAKSFESTLAVHILGSLLQAHQGKRLPGMQHDEKVKAVYMAGHDTNLILLRKLLNLRWQNDGWAENAVAPGAQLIFELAPAAPGPVVQAFLQVARPEQLRASQRFSESTPPSRVKVAITDCPGDPFACPLDAFKQMVLSKIRPECIGHAGLRELVDAPAAAWPAQYWWTFLITGLGACLLGCGLTKSKCSQSSRRELVESSQESSQELSSA